MFFPVFIVDTIKLSHRFAGPIYRLRNVIRGMAQGEPFKPLAFREMDFWQGLAEDFNEMVEKITSASDADKTELEPQSDSGVLIAK
jgi:hypothetical protein